MQCTSESAEVANHTIGDVGDLDEPRIVGLGNQRAVRHRQTYTVRNKSTVQEKVKSTTIQRLHIHSFLFYSNKPDFNSDVVIYPSKAAVTLPET